MTKLGRMRSALLPSVLIIAGFCAAQSASDEDFHVYTDSPRLLLTRQRLRLLQREHERQSPRWQQFDTLIAGGARLPEPGFSWALYYRVTGQAQWGKQAIDWALDDSSKDLRQLALIFDWCGALMTPMQAERMSGKIQRLINSGSNDLAQQSARALAAIAIADRLPDHGDSILKPLVQQWWRGEIIQKLKDGQQAYPREQTYALMELIHSVRDNLQIDLRESNLEYFRRLPIDSLVGHYPAPIETSENLYRVPVYVHEGEPNIADAVLSRAAELAMVALDSNAAETQVLQGWLMQDKFQMRGGLGVTYEFLWANPYQPGLSYFQAPLVYHNSDTGHLFARTSWDDDATWIGYFDGHLQFFRDGKLQALKAGSTEPVHIGEAVILSVQDHNSARFRADSEGVFVLGLTPRVTYDVEIDDQELQEAEADAGGTLVLSLPEGIEAGVRVRRRTE